MMILNKTQLAKYGMQNRSKKKDEKSHN